MQFSDVCFTLQLKVPHLIFMFLMLSQSLIFLSLFFLNCKLKLKRWFVLCSYIQQFTWVKKFLKQNKYKHHTVIVNWMVLRYMNIDCIFILFLTPTNGMASQFCPPFLFSLHSNLSVKYSTFHFQTPEVNSL